MNPTATTRIPRLAAAGTVVALAAALTFAAVGPAVAAPPVGSPDAYAVTQNTMLAVSAPGLWANDSDPEGDPLDYQSVAPPAGGPLPGEGFDVGVGAQGAFTYTPPTGFTGVRVWTYFLNDGVDVSGAIEVTFTITSPVVTTIPVAVADAFYVTPDTALVVPAAGLFANDYDTDGDPFGYSLVQQPAPAALPGESLDVVAGGGFTYMPPPGFVGVRTWSYSIQGDDGESALVDISFTVGTPNAAPVAVADAYLASAGVSLLVTAPGALANDTDADGEPLLMSAWDVPAGGLLVDEQFAMNAKGSFEYVAPAGYSGTRVFTYRVTDGTDESADGTITFTVSVPTPNAAPVAQADAYLVEQDVTLVVGVPGVLTNDTDADGDWLTVWQTFEPAGGALLGESLVMDASGSFEYNPAANFTGVRTWSYRATDATGPSDTAEIVFTVAAAGPAPQPQPEPQPDPQPELETGATGDSDTAALADTGADSAPLVAVIAALVLAIGTSLVRSSRRAT